MSYYAYVHARPETSVANGIFYVGKGLLKRATCVFGRNKHHQNVVAKHGAENILIGTLECSTEAIAFELEKGLIKCLRRMGVALTNMTNGGEGPAGAVRSASTRAKLSRIHSGKVLSAAQRQQISEANRSRDPSIYQKLGEKLRGRKVSDETKRKLSASLTGKKRNPEQIKNITAANSGRRYSEEARTNMAAAARKAWAKRKEATIVADGSDYTTESNHG